ncbi:RNA metabolism protein [Lithospermum erythrorhizon]|uniref:RNA metabolism protein n=1 Tax=Lithospermum erythrorhizon TaxID=34254 RepID=A0AAV3PTG4_LITER
MDGRKRGNPDGNGAFKKSRQESDSFSSGIGSKSKPCTKFFSPSGCQFGETCHFLHYVPGGIKAVTQMLGNNPALPVPPTNSVAPPFLQDRPSPAAVKTRLCAKFNTAQGCKFGDKCRFAHGEWELGCPAPSHEDPRAMDRMSGRFGSRMEPSPHSGQATSGFGEAVTTKISVDAALVGPILGKSGVNSKQICRLTGVRLSIRDHESNANLKYIELEGSYDQIKRASQMVKDLIAIGSSSGLPAKNSRSNFFTNFKTKMCENFAKGTCTFGERCHFAHGEEELRQSSI